MDCHKIATRMGAPPATERKTFSIQPREMRSNAPILLMDNTVARRSRSVRASRECATHSPPDLVDRAHWKGDVACSTALEICCEIVRATRRRTVSPVTMPRTPPLGLHNAVMRPNLTTSTISSGTVALAKILGESPETGSIDFAVQQGSQMVCGHPRRTPCCSTPRNPQILREEVIVSSRKGGRTKRSTPTT